MAGDRDSTTAFMSRALREVAVAIRRAVVFLLIVAALACWPLPAAAGQVTATGALIVRTVAPDGVPLAGVLVSVSGPLGARTQSTGVSGTIRMAGLVPGEYSASVSLEGFRQVVREGVRISVARTTELVVTMDVVAIEETITIIGESPVLDVRSTNLGSIYSADFIDMAPTASGLWAGVLDHVPGLVTDAVDVGGSESGQQSRFSARGGSPTQNKYALNAADTTDPEALGASSTYYSIASLQQVGVSTGAHDVEVQSPGVVLNMVSKTGSNDWHAAAKLFLQDEAFVASNVDDAQRERGAGDGNANAYLGDFDVQGGGPIVRDRAWFFVDYWSFAVDNLIPGLPGELDSTKIANWTINGTVQLAERHKATVRYFLDGKVRDNRGAGFGVPPESSWLQDSSVHIPQLEYQAVFGPNAFLDVRYSYMDMDFPLQARDADSPSPHPDFMGDLLPPSRERSTGALLPGSPPPREVRFLRDNSDLSANASYYLTRLKWAHDLKLGGNLSRTGSFTPENRGYRWGFEQQFLNGAPSRVRFWNHSGVDIFDVARPNAPWVRGSALGLYAQDSITFDNRITVNLGIRFDASGGRIPAQCRPASLVAELGTSYRATCIAEMSGVTSWRDVVPRIGFVFDVNADGRTAIKANYSRYSQQQGVRWAAFLNPNDVGDEVYVWSDLNGDGTFQLGEHGTLLSSFFPGVDTRIDEELASPLTDELSAGLEHEVVPNLLLSATAIYRTDGNFVEDVNIGIPYGPIAGFLGVPSAYTPVTVTDPGPDGVVGTGDDGGPLTIFSQDPSTFGETLLLLTNPVQRMGFDFLYNRYVGLSLVMHKRWNDDWQLLASWDIGRAEGTFDFGGASGTASLLDGPNSDLKREGLTAWDRTHLVKVTGNYLLAEPWNLNIGAFLRVQSGEPVVRRAILPTPIGEAAGPAESLIDQGNEQVRVEARGRHTNAHSVERLDAVAILDLRAEKRLTAGRYGTLRLFADLFNVFNTNTVTAIEEDSSAAYNDIFWLVSPRVFRFGLGWDF